MVEEERVAHMKSLAVLILVLILFGSLSTAWDIQPVKAAPETSITIGTTDSVEVSLDPAQAYDYSGWNIIRNIGCGLVDFRPGSTAGIDDAIPALATDWLVSSDGLVWTFNLRQGVHYNDGTEFNATHVKYTFDRGISVADPDGAFVGIGYDNIIDSIEVAGEYQVMFRLKIQFSPFLSLLALPPSFIVNPTYTPIDRIVSYVDGDARASYPTDLGPYILTEWVRSGWKDIEMKLDANPHYWNATGGYPKTQKITVRFYNDSASLRSAIEPEEIDVAFRGLSMDDVDALKHDAALKVWEGTGVFIQYLVFQTKSEMYPLNITEARRAIAAAINRTILTETVFLGQTEPLYSTIPNGMAGHVAAFRVLGDANYTYTRSLLAELGYNESSKLTFDLWFESSGHYPMSAEQALLYKEALEASGVISVTLKSADWASYRQNRNSEIMDVYIYGWSPDYVDPDDYTYPLLHSTGGSWLHNNYADPEMDTLIENARATMNATERDQIYAQIQLLTAQDCPIVPLFQTKTYAVTKSSQEGIYLDISQLLRYWLLYSTNQPTTWIVDDDGPADFHTIQEAINAAIDGDTVFVRNGTYDEHLTINKTIGLIGEDRNATIIDNECKDPPEMVGSVVLVTADNVNMSGFTIQHCRSGGNAIGLNNHVNMTFSNNIITGCNEGIRILYSSGNVVSHNTIGGCYYNTGIGFDWAYNNTVSNNIVIGNHIGMSGGAGYGPNEEPYNNTYSENIINGNDYGFLGAIYNSTFFHNNFVDNNVQAAFYESYIHSPNLWDNGYPAGGNYWSDSAGVDVLSGPYQNETGSDGIGDTPYVIDADDKDRYPLMHPWGSLVLYGDVNGDGAVNILDVILVSEAFGTSQGDPDYDPSSDLNQDGRINVLDTILVAKNFGQHIP